MMQALRHVVQRIRPVAAPTGLIAAHFSQHELQLLQLRGCGSELAIQASASLPFVGERDEFLASRKAVRTLIQRGLKAAPFRGRKTISTLPFEHVKLMSISYPAGPAGKEEETIASLMAERVEGDLSDYVIDYVPVRTSIRDGERLCLVAVSPREQVIAYLDTLRAAGLQPEALEVAPLSIRRLVERMSSPSNIENVLAITTGLDTTYLTLISGRRLLANQAMPFGVSRLIDSICDALDVSPDVANELLTKNGLGEGTGSKHPPTDDIAIGATLLEIVRPAFVDLVNEIERAFLYAASESYGQATKRIYLFGSLAKWPGADRLVTALTQIPVETMRFGLMPFDIDPAAIENGESPAGLSVAAGMALCGFGEHD